MYLAKLTLDRSRRAYYWSLQPYRVHQRLCLACPDDPRLLWRLEDDTRQPHLLVQSHQEPDWGRAFDEFAVLAEPPQQKTVTWALSPGDVLAFRLRANPSMKKTFEDGKKRIGLYDEDDQWEWLTRKAEQAGFRVLRAEARQEGMVRGTHTGRRGIRMLSVRWDGLLGVLDAARLREALVSGVGSGKAMGFGLLSLAPGSPG